MTAIGHTVVVGGSSGIGLATARMLAESGNEVTIAGRSAERLERVRQELGLRTAAVDARDRAAVADFVGSTPPFRHLVISVAAGAALGPFGEITEPAFRDTFDGKFWPYANLLSVAAKTMRPPGSICMVTGASAISAAPGAATLSAVNGALEGMVKTLAVELAPLRVNAVSPGLTDTEAWARIPRPIREQMYQQAAETTPAGRIGKPHDVASAIFSILQSEFITGVVLPCDGGKRLT